MRALGIDVGTTTTKVVLVEVDGEHVREVSSRAARTPPDVPGLLDVVAAGSSALLDGGVDVSAVGVASMAETGAPVDAHGTALTDLIRWDAGRGAADAEAMASLAPEVFARTGVRLSAKTPLATWAWLRREQPAVWSRMHCWLGAADLVVQGLTGERVTDHTLAGRTGGYRLPDIGDPPPEAFDTDLLDLVGLDSHRLPRVAAPGDIAGHVIPSTRTGLPAGLPVVVAGHDHQVAAWAAGVRDPGDVADSLGTAEAVLSVIDRRPDADWVRGQGMSLVRTVGGGADALVAGSSSAGAMLQHWLASVPQERHKSVLADAATQLAADSRPTGAAVLPYLRGRQTPAPDPDARAGHPPSGWPYERQARAVVEGICYQARWMIETQVGPRTPRSIAVIGGDRLPQLWTGLKRATLPWPLQMVQAGEPVAIGAALLALVRSGAIDRARPPVLSSTTTSPPGWDPHAAAFAAFVDRAGGGLPVPAARRRLSLP